jgi:hypothetical protein
LLQVDIVFRAYSVEMAFEIDHVGVVVDVAITSRQWSAEATLFAVGADGRRITATHANVFSAEALAALEEE